MGIGWTGTVGERRPRSLPSDRGRRGKGGEEFRHSVVGATFGVAQRGAAPAVLRRRVGTAVEQVLDDLEVPLGGSQMQRGAFVVVGGVRILAGGEGDPDVV